MPARVSPETTFYFALFIAPVGTPAPLSGWDEIDDPNWQYVVAFATNHTSAAGRFTAPTATVPGYAAGTTISFVVRAWAALAGAAEWPPARPWYGAYGQSTTGTAVLGGEVVTNLIPTPSAFGLGTTQISGFEMLPACPECVPPNFGIQPTSASVGLGGVVTFIAYTGIWPGTSFQWRKEGAPISGTNSSAQTIENLSQLTITNVTLADAGNYDVVAANAYGTSTSKVATLTVLIPATIGSPKYTLNNQFQFTVTGATGSNYVVQVATNLAPPTTWISHYTNAAPFTFIDSGANSFPQRFYRANAR